MYAHSTSLSKRNTIYTLDAFLLLQFLTRLLLQIGIVINEYQGFTSILVIVFYEKNEKSFQIELYGLTAKIELGKGTKNGVGDSFGWISDRVHIA